MVTAYVALGANLGDALAALRHAVAALGLVPFTRLVNTSSVYKTAPLNTDDELPSSAPGADYLNAVVQLQTRLTAPALLSHLQRIEQAAGRVRSYRNAPRTLDLDLLLYGSASMNSASLTVPHPRMLQRAFVLVPLAEIAPERVSAAQLEVVASQGIERLGGVAG